MELTYTPKQRRNIAKALRLAKKRLSRKHGPNEPNLYICLCLNQVAEATKSPGIVEGCQDAKEIIQDRLTPFSSVGGWLDRMVGFGYGDYSYHLQAGHIQDYRHRWIDALIEEFSE